MISFGEQESNTFDMKCVQHKRRMSWMQMKELQVEGQDTPWP